MKVFLLTHIIVKNNFIKFKLFEQIKNVMFEILHAEFKNKLSV